MISKYDKKKKGSGPYNHIIVWLWRLFSSIRFAIILILIITALSLLGALLIQAPSEIAKDPQAYSNWINTVAQGKVGNWAPFLSALRLFNVFSSPWFITAGILLMLNILICSLNRWRAISLSIRGGKVKQVEKFYTDGKTNIDFRI